MWKRELIDTGTDKRYLRRDEDSKFTESVDVGRSLSTDKRHYSRGYSKRQMRKNSARVIWIVPRCGPRHL
ncbi:hypothetical protein [Peteryoungia algae]|uniref:Uncharacterized protein n=1 Tax=Peteryoungia algae TaxID=2919917 RepID=A0ABT0CU53_9HYPH|nr:hypothetical protein [Rhizobium sp. SSM4.3]MCJ8236707.1 hypothetical protein [Rhizobium sp. SSM4.3]